MLEILYQHLEECTKMAMWFVERGFKEEAEACIVGAERVAEKACENERISYEEMQEFYDKFNGILRAFK